MTAKPLSAVAPGRIKAISFAGYVCMMSGLAGLFLTKNLFSWSLAVIFTQVIGTALVLWARHTFGRRSFHAGANPTEGGLVTSGPYRYIRHPIYSGLCLCAAAGVAAHASREAYLFGMLMLAGALIRIFCEETLVRLRYPEYSGYAKRTWRMAPFLF